MSDRVGQQLGNYQLIRLLGEGGFAEVYLDKHIHLGTQAAIKGPGWRIVLQVEEEHVLSVFLCSAPTNQCFSSHLERNTVMNCP